MKEIGISELRQIQIEILKEIADYCDKESLSYFLGYGTLIGAVRHHGYIPWDDDIDIIMPRPDYEKFVHGFNQQQRDMKVVDYNQSSEYELPYAKVFDTRTRMIETMYKPIRQFGVYIDVFPIDGYKERAVLRKIRLLNEFLNAKKAVRHNNRTWAKTIIINLGKIVLFPFPISFILNRMNSLARKYRYEECETVNSMFSPYCLHEMCPKSWLSKYIMAEFEGETFRIPESYDQYLRNIYGDYMQLPPKEKQVTHHIFKAWWIE